MTDYSGDLGGGFGGDIGGGNLNGGFGRDISYGGGGIGGGRLYPMGGNFNGAIGGNLSRIITQTIWDWRSAKI